MSKLVLTDDAVIDGVLKLTNEGTLPILLKSVVYREASMVSRTQVKAVLQAVMLIHQQAKEKYGKNKTVE